MSLNAATAAPSDHFLVSRKNPLVIAQTHLISVSLISDSLISDSLRKEGELFEYLTNIIK